MLLASVSHLLRAVTLGNHHERSTIVLELIHVWVHAVRSGRSHRTTRIALWSLGRTRIENRIVLEVLWHFLTSIQTSLQLRMSNVTSHDDSTLQVHTSRNRILAQFLANSVNALVQVNLDALAAFAWTTILFRNQFRRIAVHHFEPNTILVNLCLDVAVGRARNTHTNRTTCTMTRQTNHTDVMSQILATKLSSKTNLVSFLQQLLFQIHVAECTSRLVTRRWQRVIVFDRSELHRQEVLLSRRTTNHESNVVRRTSRRAETLHLLHQEWEQSTLVLNGSLSHWVEVSLVSRTTTLRHHHEAVFSTFRSLNINLSREVTLRVHLVVHIQWSILRVAEVVLRESVEHTFRQRLFVLKARPHLLALFAVDDSRTRVLAERKNALGSCLSIAQELKSHILVVLRSLRVAQNLSHLQVMLTAQHELHVVESLLSQQRQSLWRDLHDFLSFEFADRDTLLRQQSVFRLVLSHLKHRSILKFWCLCHNINLELVIICFRY